MRIRVVGLIIIEGKLLLVRAKDHKELWTPGGRLEAGEKFEDCLKRELYEEINANVDEYVPFKDFVELSPFSHTEVKNVTYIVKASGDLRPKNEIGEIVWVSRADYEKRKYSYGYIIEEQIIPELVRSGFF